MLRYSWLVARNTSGTYGKVPENYLQAADELEDEEVRAKLLPVSYCSQSLRVVI